MKQFVEHQLVKENTVENRLYQDSLVRNALEKGNTLVVAPTALGKTIVAVLLAAEILQKSPEKKILLVAPTKPLAEQHRKSFSKFLKIDEEKISILTGTLNPEKRSKIWDKSSIICATPQAIENDLISGKMNLEEVSLLIFDEAHRATGNYSYVFMARQYARQNPNGLSVGLTASPGHERERIQDVCKNLFIKNLEIKNREDEDVKPYINEVSMTWLKLDLPVEFQEIRKHIEVFIDEQLELLRKMGYPGFRAKNLSKKMLLDLQMRIRKDLAGHGREKPYLYVAISRSACLLKISHAHTLLETQGIFSLKQYLERIAAEAKEGGKKADKFIVSHPEIIKAKEICDKLYEQKIDHPKIDALKRILKEQFANNPESRVLVFNHYRDSITNIEKYLKEIPGIKAKRFVGQADKGTEKGLKQSEQVEIIESLKKGVYNTLLCSSVAEEGIDIPSVDLVIFYEPVPSEIRTIQRRGRTGRLDKGKVIVLMAKGTKDEAFYWTATTKERQMKKMLHELKGAGEKKSMLPKQQTLIKYAESGEDKDKIFIYVDYREQQSSVARELKEMGAEIIMRKLDVADYQLTDDICVERKTIADFLQSIVDGRLFEQAGMLSSNFKSPLIIVEGDFQSIYSERNINKNAIVGALTSIMLSYRIPIFPTVDDRETAEILFNIAKREQIGKGKDIKLRMGRKGVSIPEKQQFIIESLPNVGPTLAKKLLREFKTIKTIANSNEKELENAEGIGKLKAKGIFEVFNSEFKEEE